ncbi:hypothetical protein K7X08_037466 [Anisodus acutangulus]|uniref:Uncharacterized protein n=1 Tax=Anisodus acutangulus TaxID=402998 RepID=A0A9Q1RS95_9SOLA|nr:hypothetical protein K7X08_037466 [Anisodus acutangulus]
MSTNSQSRHFWKLTQNNLGYYQAPANYHYVSRNTDPYLWNGYAATTNYDTGYYNYYYQPTSEYIDDHVYIATDQFLFIVSTNLQNRHLS